MVVAGLTDAAPFECRDPRQSRRRGHGVRISSGDARCGHRRIPTFPAGKVARHIWRSSRKGWR